MSAKNAARPSILHVGGSVVFHLRQLRSFVVSLWTPDLRLALLLCIPGVAVAIALRLWLLYHMPAGFVHGDTAQQLITPLTLLERGHFVVNSKKTFLTPLLYSISALAHIPVLYFAAAVQHLVGVLARGRHRPSRQGVVRFMAAMDRPADGADRHQSHFALV